MISICIASNNHHKIEEIAPILGAKFRLLTLKDIGCFEELPETGNSLEENSLQKARFISEKYKIPCIADDSGLEIEALGNQPGVHSAYYSGSRDSIENMKKVLGELSGCVNRSAKFKTVITYIDSHFNYSQFVGIVEGNILVEMRGEGGFGYDPIFIPNGSNKSFAEMTQNEKSAISHRTRALLQFKNFLKI